MSNPSNQPEPKSPEYRKGRIEAIQAYIDTCEQEGVSPSWTTLRDFQQGQLLAQQEIESRQPNLKPSKSGELKADAQAEAGLRERLYRAALFTVTTNDAKHYEKIADEFAYEAMQLFQADKSAAVLEILERLRAPFAVDEETLSSDGVHQRPAAQGRNKMKQRIRDVIDAELARLQPPTAGEGESV